MNFFGHACVAGWFSEREPFIFGAMLPDFASALRVAPPLSCHDELNAGIRLHHATDAVFHRATDFAVLESHARSVLAGLGVSKGARRALAHIGVEFLIDEQLGERTAARVVYSAALAFGATEACHSALAWSTADVNQRLARLCRHLSASAEQRGVADRVLAARLVACLAGRPRLELRPEEAELLVPWLAECRPLVIAKTPSLLAELALELRAPELRS